MSALHPLNVNVVNGRGIARRASAGASGMFAAAFAVWLFLHIVLAVACVALVVAVLALIVRVTVRVVRARRPRPIVAVPARVNDAAAKAHRDRMAAILGR